MNELIAGRYELRARISKGGMGAVWRAHDRRLRRDVAVKLLHSWIAENEELRRRFAREARVLAPLENEHIVRLYDHGEDGETPFLVMELVEGANLAEAARERSFSWPDVVEIAVPVATALSYAHARGIVHRDLTPGNVLIESATGRVVVSDFGLARIARSATSVTTQGMLLGTPEYWSPEQARGADSETATDLYALGCLLFWLLSGRTPFEGDDRLAVGLRRAHEEAPSLATRVPDAPEDAVRLVDALLARDPAERPTADEVLARLGAEAPAIAGAAAEAAESAERATAVFSLAPATQVLEPPRRHAAPRRRRSRLTALVAAGIAAAGGLAFVGATIANADRVVEVPQGDGDDGAAGASLGRRRGPPRRSQGAGDGRLADVFGVRARRPGRRTDAGTGSPRRAQRPRRRPSRQPRHRVRAGPGGRGSLEGRRAGGTAPASASRAAVRTEESWEVPEGRVISSDQRAGEDARRPGPVGLVVSSGPPKAAVPDVRGIAVDDAVGRLDGSFDADVVEEGSTSFEPGTVLRQSPGAGLARRPGLDRDAHRRPRAGMGDDVVGERQRRVRLGGDRGDSAAGRLADRGRACGRAISSSAPGRPPSPGKEPAPATSPSTRSGRTRSRR